MPNIILTSTGTLPPPEPGGDFFTSLHALRVDAAMPDGPPVTKELTTVRIDKPSGEWFVRAHPDAENYGLDTLVLELKQQERETYFIAPEMRQHLLGESTVRLKRLRLAVNRQGDPFVWPVRLPGGDGRLDSWSESALEAMELATSKWVRLVSNRRIGAYDILTANIEEQPVWPAKTFNEVLRIAFKGYIIDSLDHPVLRRLRGEA